MKSESERYVILFNGEIYNFLELKKDLIYLQKQILIQKLFYNYLKNLDQRWLICWRACLV